MKNWTKQDFRLAKKYPELAKRAELKGNSPSKQSLLEQSNAIEDYENTYVVNGKDILTGATV